MYRISAVGENVGVKVRQSLPDFFRNDAKSVPKNSIILEILFFHTKLPEKAILDIVPEMTPQTFPNAFGFYPENDASPVFWKL